MKLFSFNTYLKHWSKFELNYSKRSGDMVERLDEDLLSIVRKLSSLHRNRNYTEQGAESSDGCSLQGSSSVLWPLKLTLAEDADGKIFSYETMGFRNDHSASNDLT